MSITHPTNEQETIYHFIKMESEFGFETLQFNSIFPDAQVLDVLNDKVYKVEFEYKLSSFIKHGHDPYGCDFVVCWINDISYFEFPLTVWELSSNSYPNIEVPSPAKLQELGILIKSKRFRKYDYRNKAEESSKGIFDDLISRISGIN